MTRPTKLVYVNVTEEHIHNGAPGIHNACPVALAVRDLVTPDARISVTPQKLVIHSAKGTSGFIFPTSTRRFIAQVDLREDVKPTRFRFRIPVDVLR